MFRKTFLATEQGELGMFFDVGIFELSLIDCCANILFKKLPILFFFYLSIP